MSWGNEPNEPFPQTMNSEGEKLIVTKNHATVKTVEISNSNTDGGSRALIVNGHAEIKAPTENVPTKLIINSGDGLIGSITINGKTISVPNNGSSMTLDMEVFPARALILHESGDWFLTINGPTIINNGAFEVNETSELRGETTMHDTTRIGSEQDPQNLIVWGQLTVNGGGNLTMSNFIATEAFKGIYNEQEIRLIAEAAGQVEIADEEVLTVVLGNLEARSNLQVYNDASVGNTLRVNSIEPVGAGTETTFNNKLKVDDNHEVTGNLDVGGNSVLEGNLKIDGTLKVDQVETTGGPDHIDFNDKLVINDDLDVTGDSNLGNVKINTGTLEVGEIDTPTGVDRVNIDAAAKIGGNFEINGETSAKKITAVDDVDGTLLSASNTSTETDSIAIDAQGQIALNLQGKMKANGNEVILDDSDSLGYGMKYNPTGHGNGASIDFYINSNVVGYLDSEGWHNA